MSREFIDNGHTRLAVKRLTHADSSFSRLANSPPLHGSRQCEQVAAICYRMGRSGGLEFLLVKTRGGRWIFPKGSVEPGLSHAQAAALEAFEEAGVHGRIEEEPFIRYVRCDPKGKKMLTTAAHLCEVVRLGKPKERKRDPSWYSPEKAKRRLREGRSARDADELAGVLDRAATRIQEPEHPTILPTDPLQKVQFESREAAGIQQQITQTSYFRYVRREQVQGVANELAINGYHYKVLRAGSSDSRRSVGPVRNERARTLPQLTDGSHDLPQKVTPIDHPRRREHSEQVADGKRRKGSPSS